MSMIYTQILRYMEMYWTRSMQNTNTRNGLYCKILYAIKKVSVISEILCLKASVATVWFFGRVLIEDVSIIYYNNLLLFMIDHFISVMKVIYLTGR
jgi:hypothetical protein